MNRAVLVYSDEVLKYDFGPHHPLQPVRYRLTRDLMDAYGLFERENILASAPTSASDAELELVHDPEYVSAVRSLDRSGGGAAMRAGLGAGDNPVFRKMHEVSAVIAGGSIDAARMVVNGDVDYAFNIAGGLHHAMPSRASGFCIYNDPAIAIAWLLRNGAGRIAYIDTDAHHGDGVQWIFYDDPRVLTISIHESGRYLFPGTGDVCETGRGRGRGTSVNVPLDPGASDPDMLLALDEAALPLAQSFDPDILVLQHGCDSHRLDPLTHLECTLNVFPEIARRERELAVDVAGGRAIGTGGGGYAFRDVVPRAWTSTFSTLAGVDLPETLPDTWCDTREDGSMPLTAEDPVAESSLASTKTTIGRLMRELGRFRG